MKQALLLIICLSTLITAKGREVTQLKDWKFYPAYDVSRNPKLTEVTVPHTWNQNDVFNGMKYERGTYVYERLLESRGRFY